MLVALAAVLGMLAWKRGLLAVAAPQTINVTVVGHSWWWEIVYPDLGFKTANELHVPIGSDIHLQLISVDVLHTLRIPELAIEAQALPGQVNNALLRVEKPGEVGGECTEICGTAHTMMRLKVVADTQDDFHAWVSDQQKPASTPQTERQRAGYDVLSTVCASCHSLDPAEPRADLLGPNLAHLMSRSVFAGASFELNEGNLRRWLGDPQAMKAGNHMIVNLPRDEFDAAMEVLLLLK